MSCDMSENSSAHSEVHEQLGSRLEHRVEVQAEEDTLLLIPLFSVFSKIGSEVFREE